MTHKEIKELIKIINDSNLTEFKMKADGIELSIRTQGFVNKKQLAHFEQPQVVQVPPPVAQTPAPAEVPEKITTKEENTETNYLEVRSPIVGTFYRASAPDKPPYVKVGDTIEVGTVVCIVEAMKLFNEIESEISGTIVKVMVEDAQPIEYDQVLFLVEPN